MTDPFQKVSRKEFNAFARVRWNAMNDICALSDIRELTPVQRVAHLAYWYMSEVYNGGHPQYLVNRREFDHGEVIRALQTIGASEQASILAEVLSAVGTKTMDVPRNVEEYFSSEKASNLSGFDTRFYGSRQGIEACLQDYLDKHESDFIEWIP